MYGPGFALRNTKTRRFALRFGARHRRRNTVCSYESSRYIYIYIYIHLLAQCRRNRQIGHVGGGRRTMRQREAAVRSIAAPGRAILCVFRCVIKNFCPYCLKTWLITSSAGFDIASPVTGRPLVTHTIFGAVDCHYLCQACCVAHQSFPCPAKGLGVLRWPSHQEFFMTRWECLVAASWQNAVLNY